MLQHRDKWYGVTYREDKPTVVAAIAQKTQDGLYRKMRGRDKLKWAQERNKICGSPLDFLSDTAYNKAVKRLVAVHRTHQQQQEAPSVLRIPRGLPVC